MANAEEKAMVEEAKNLWWLLLIEGLAAILIGWLVLSTPGVTTYILVQLLGLYWIAAGVVDITVGIFDKDAESRGWKLIGGLIGVFAGFVVLANKLFAGVLVPTTLMYMIAFAFIINGVIRVFVGGKTPEGTNQRSWGNFFIGLFYVILGVALLGMPLIVSVTSTIFTIGLLAIFGGIVMIVLGFKTKSMVKQLAK